jgi:hypothetical protein
MATHYPTALMRQHSGTCAAQAQNAHGVRRRDGALRGHHRVEVSLDILPPEPHPMRVVITLVGGR